MQEAKKARQGQGSLLQFLVSLGQDLSQLPFQVAVLPPAAPRAQFHSQEADAPSDRAFPCEASS